MKFKSTPALIKKAGVEDGLPAGQFTAYASVFENVDSYGDVVHKGAFADTLTAWKDSGAPIPLYWAHQIGADPMFNLGQVMSAEEDEKGLLVTAQLDVAHNEKAAYTYQLIKGRRVQQMSFAYDVVDSTEREDSGGLDLKSVKLHEVSIVPLGANQETEIIDVKMSRGKMPGDPPPEDPPAGDDTEAATDTEMLTQALSWMTTIDKVADNAQEVIAKHLGVDNPDPEDAPGAPEPGKGYRASRKSGRVISAKTGETVDAAMKSVAAAMSALRDCHAALTSMTSTNDQEDPSGDGPEKNDERYAVKFDEPSHANPTGDPWTALLLLELEGLK